MIFPAFIADIYYHTEPIIYIQEKKTAKAVFFGEGISLMGCSKNYIMYWGVFTVIIVSCSQGKVCTNMDFFCAIFYSFFYR